MTSPATGFDFGADPRCGQGVLHAVVEEGDLLLVCDEDGSVYRHPDLIRSPRSISPGSDDDPRSGGGSDRRPGTWRFATIAEVEEAGWEGFLRVELLVEVSGPPWLVDGAQVRVGASTTREEVRTDALVAHLIMRRELAGRSIDRMVLAPSDAGGTFAGLVRPVDILGRAIPVEGSGTIDFTGTVRGWGPPSPGPV
ncbi:MAG TPA: hypothetical protein VFW51_07740 [Actinomycetota bacterium]|nr:hypothetical protein [Actinomycetota bacterium]